MVLAENEDKRVKMMPKTVYLRLALRWRGYPAACQRPGVFAEPGQVLQAVGDHLLGRVVRLELCCQGRAEVQDLVAIDHEGRTLDLET